MRARKFTILYVKEMLSETTVKSELIPNIRVKSRVQILFDALHYYNNIHRFLVPEALFTTHLQILYNLNLLLNKHCISFYHRDCDWNIAKK